MPKLPESETEKIINLLKEGKSLPEDYREDIIQQLEQLKRLHGLLGRLHHAGEIKIDDAIS